MEERNTKVRGNNRSRFKRRRDDKRRILPSFGDMPLVSMMPIIITICALCCGTTAIRMSLLGRFDLAIFYIFLAAVMHALDGHVARFLNSTRKFGAEPDSCHDLLCVGMAPPFLVTRLL